MSALRNRVYRATLAFTALFTIAVALSIHGPALARGRSVSGTAESTRAKEAKPVPPSIQAVTNPILFVTQVPVPGDFTTIGSVFGNHFGDVDSAARGGDLYIRYPDGTLKNLTRTAGYGMPDGLQTANAIAVREPSVHWNGTKALFSMVVGSVPQQYQVASFYWQIYEITGLGPTDTHVITKVPFQPANYNNVSPFYGTDDRVLFTSDMPRNGSGRHLYPQLDEYESAATTTGIYSLDPTTGDLRFLNHSPSGVFSPTIDSYGRVIFTRWDHLQRDQQADQDSEAETYGTFNYADEAATAQRLAVRDEVFPEPRAARTDLLAGTNLEGHSLNQFFPWQINEDGTEEETLNHIGRHELAGYFNRTLNDDNNLREFIAGAVTRFNPNSIGNMLQIKEDPLAAGTFFGIDAPEFSTHAAGQIISLPAPPTLPADQIAVTYRTHRDTASFRADDEPASPTHSGLYRNPLPLSGGTLVAVHTPETRQDRNEGTRANPTSRYDFRLKTLKVGTGINAPYLVPDQPLTPGISRTVSYWDPDVLVTYSGALWELDPVEVRARPRPIPPTHPLPPAEQMVFDEEGVNVAALKTYLRSQDLALIVMRNLTTRDTADKQQPLNLRVAGTTTQSVPTGGKIYDIAHLQLFQGDQIRGMGGTVSPRDGRRVIAQPMHERAVRNPANPTGPISSVAIGTDGSAAAFVPAHRAMTWQMTDPAGTPVVRERYWLTFQPGEIRTCTSCHGLNSQDQTGQPTPANKPEALRKVLRYWKTLTNPAPAAAAKFYTLTPCRLLDTRNPTGPFGGPPLQSSSLRTVSLAGRCGVPATASAVSVNQTVVSPIESGNLVLFSAEGTSPATTNVAVRAGHTRANNGIVQVSKDSLASIAIRNDAAGAMHFVLDVNGYFE